MVTLANLIMVLMGWTEVQCLVGEERLNSASFLIRLYGMMVLMLSYSQHRASSHFFDSFDDSRRSGELSQWHPQWICSLCKHSDVGQASVEDRL